VETPERALKGFSRVDLQAGETRTVTFLVPQRQLAVWSAEKKWAVEPGRYTVWVGDSSRASLNTEFNLRP
jgi:beta-glucosidase